jgi:hypothetical protein
MSAAVNLARTTANNDGQVPPTYLSTRALMEYHGYSTGAFGAMRYYNPNGATPQDVVNFWLNANSATCPRDADCKQMSVGVWIIDNKLSAVALMGTRG